jgi:hypothetical protein
MKSVTLNISRAAEKARGQLDGLVTFTTSNDTTAFVKDCPLDVRRLYKTGYVY